MDSERFDRLTRAFAQPATRRSFVKSLTGGILGGAAGLSALGPAAAQHCAPPGQSCAADADCCGALTCGSGSCQPPGATGGGSSPGNQGCATGLSRCGGSCIDLLTDVDNCGGCGTVCTTNVANAVPTCSNGACGYACTVRACGDGSCAPTGGCCTASECSSSECASATCTGNECGTAPVAAGQACGTGQTCSNAVVKAQDTCDGKGTCVSGATTTCTTNVANANPVCNGASCGYACAVTTCADGSCAAADGCCADADCVDDSYLCHPAVCQNNQCVNQLAVGAPCATDACLTGMMCQSDGSCGGGTEVNCDDGLSCTNDACKEGIGCTHTLADGTCLIDGECVLAGEPNANNVCQVCDPTQDPHSWSNQPTTTLCGVAQCNGTTYTPASYCDGAGTCQQPASTACPASKCTTATCNPTTGCGATINTNSCLIGGTCYNTGDRNPFDQCQSCQPDQSQTDWKIAGGASCTVGADTGECCAIDGSCCGGTCHCCSGYACIQPDTCRDDGSGNLECS